MTICRREISLIQTLPWSSAIGTLNVEPYCDRLKGGKVSQNLFAHPNLPTLIKSKPIQLLVGLNEHQPN